MMRRIEKGNRLASCAPGAALLLALALWPAAAAAQTTTGTLRGLVKDETGGVLPGVTVEAVDEESGLTRSAFTSRGGFYNIQLPPGSYSVTATLQNFAPQTKKVVMALGETQGLDFELTVTATAGESVVVTAEVPLVEAKSPEISTNVSEFQLENLPQDNRNFLNFAKLAPGVRISDAQAGGASANRQEVTAGALEGFTTNVFIDGASYKNDVLLGGVVGQDASRGNPFPQSAVQEFRVLTQNYKAEYEKSSSAVITAVTKSGTNAFHGDAFVEYQDKALVARDVFNPEPNEKPDYTRWQAGVSVGGPIVKDKVHFFASWELNDQNRANRVFIGAQENIAPPDLLAQLETYTGLFTIPFTENLLFGKVSYQVAPVDVIDFNGFWRNETDIRDVGGNSLRSFETRTDVQQDIWNVGARNALTGNTWLSETLLMYQYYRWNPTIVNPQLIGQEYQQLLRIGGQDSAQRFVQKRFQVRQDFSYFALRAAGDHVLKGGVVLNFNDYDVQKNQLGNPVFKYRSVENWAFPFEAQYGFGNPDLSATNNQYGVYVQDDWTVTPRLTVNLGLRWDYETDDLNNDYVTPPLVVSELAGKVPADYFTDGTQRPSFSKAFQPRLGFAYDLSGKGTTIFFGGWGRFYDRNYYNALLDERFRLQYSLLTFRFSADGLPRDNQPTIIWDPAYLSVAGLQGIIDSGQAPLPEAFLIRNNTDPPVADQFGGGFRQTFGGMIGVSISYAGARSRNGYTYIWGSGRCCPDPPLSTAFSNVLISDASKRTKYDALFVTLDKPYTVSSKWGATLAFTWANGRGNGGDLFSLDYANVAAYPQHPTANAEQLRLVVSGIVGLPWDMRFSTLLTLGSGLGFTLDDASAGFGPGRQRILLYQGQQEGTFPYQTWDLQLSKDFYFGQSFRAGALISVFNVLNHSNYGDFNGFIPPATDPPNPNFGVGNTTVTLPRRLQFGVSFGF
jgi:hypothetical protein